MQEWGYCSRRWGLGKCADWPCSVAAQRNGHGDTGGSLQASAAALAMSRTSVKTKRCATGRLTDQTSGRWASAHAAAAALDCCLAAASHHLNSEFLCMAGGLPGRALRKGAVSGKTIILCSHLSLQGHSESASGITSPQPELLTLPVLLSQRAASLRWGLHGLQ